MTEVEMELSWLQFIATRDAGETDEQHGINKRMAWEMAKQLAKEQPQKFAELPAMLTQAMRPRD